MFLVRIDEPGGDISPFLRAANAGKLINLEITGESLALARVLRLPQAVQIRALDWGWATKAKRAEVEEVVPLLVALPGLEKLSLGEVPGSAFDFASLLLESGSQLKSIRFYVTKTGNAKRLFAALEGSQVEALDILSEGGKRFIKALPLFLAKDRLTRLRLYFGYHRARVGLIESLAGCKRLTQLTLSSVTLPASLVLPGSVTTLLLSGCTLATCRNWQVGNVHTLCLNRSTYTADCLSGQVWAGLKDLAVHFCEPPQEIVEIDHDGLRSLKLVTHALTEAEVVLIEALVRGGVVKTLFIPYHWTLATRLLPALREGNLTKLRFMLGTGVDRSARRLEQLVCGRAGLFALLHGQQVRRLGGPLQRLPVEMMRLVGEMVI